MGAQITLRPQNFYYLRLKKWVRNCALCALGSAAPDIEQRNNFAKFVIRNLKKHYDRRSPNLKFLIGLLVIKIQKNLKYVRGGGT